MESPDIAVMHALVSLSRQWPFLNDVVDGVRKSQVDGMIICARCASTAFSYTVLEILWEWLKLLGMAKNG